MLTSKFWSQCPTTSTMPGSGAASITLENLVKVMDSFKPPPAPDVVEGQCFNCKTEWPKPLLYNVQLGMFGTVVVPLCGKCYAGVLALPRTAPSAARCSAGPAGTSAR